MRMMREGADDGKRDALDRITQAFDSAPVAITLADTHLPDTPLVVVNRAFTRLSGYAQEALIGRNCRHLQSDLDNVQSRAEVRLALEEGRSAQVMFRNRHKSGQVFDNLLIMEPLATRKGEVRYFLGSQFIITSRYTTKALESHVHHMDEALSKVTQGLEESRNEHRRLIADAAKLVAEAWLSIP
ncbi:MAG: PAS domain S-box protein [Pseudomonadota bacterium]